MPKKKKPAFTFKELLFGYLAISKLMYWMNNISAIQQDALIEVWRFVLNRLLSQDIMIVWMLVAMFLLEYYIDTHPSVSKGKVRHILVYGIGYLVYIASVVTYILLLSFFIDTQIGSWGELILSFTGFYAIACVVMNVKEHMKKKEAEMYIPAEEVIGKADGDTLALLTALHERGVLTTDEYESKKKETVHRDTAKGV